MSTKRSPIIGLVAVVIALVVAAIFFYFRQPVDYTSQSTIPATATDEMAPTGSAASISSIVITPSTKDGVWTTYRSGAQVVVMATGLQSVAIMAMPTGSGAGEEYPDGLQIATSTKSSSLSGVDTWTAILPNDVLATSLWAQGVDPAGNIVKSADLGSVGYSDK